MKFATRKVVKKAPFLQRIDRAWGYTRGTGCLAFEIDDRYVRDDGIEYRYAVSYGEYRGDAKPGATYFWGVAIATRRRLVTVVGHGNVEPAESETNATNAKAAARRILARIADAEYPRFVLDDAKPTALVRRSNPDVIRGLEPKSFGFFFGTRDAPNEEVPPC